MSGPSLHHVPAEAPPSLRSIAERVEQRLDAFLTPELDRWAAFDGDLLEPMAEIRRLVLLGGSARRSATGGSSGPAATRPTRSWSTPGRRSS